MTDQDHNKDHSEGMRKRAKPFALIVAFTLVAGGSFYGGVITGYRDDGKTNVAKKTDIRVSPECMGTLNRYFNAHLENEFTTAVPKGCEIRIPNELLRDNVQEYLVD